MGRGWLRYDFQDSVLVGVDGNADGARHDDATFARGPGCPEGVTVDQESTAPVHFIRRVGSQAHSDWTVTLRVHRGLNRIPTARDWPVVWSSLGSGRVLELPAPRVSAAYSNATAGEFSCGLPVGPHIMPPAAREGLAFYWRGLRR